MNTTLTDHYFCFIQLIHKLAKLSMEANYRHFINGLAAMPDRAFWTGLFGAATLESE
jgi:hypothetical protein